MGAFYHPIPTGGRLHFKLGYVGTGNMVPGSPRVSQCNVPGITSADIGTQCSVIAAGPSPATAWLAGGVNSGGDGVHSPAYDTVPGGPTYPAPYDTHGHSLTPGMMLVSTIANVFDAGTFDLNASASSTTQDGAANVTIYREVSTDINNPLKVQHTLTTSSRATLTATIYDAKGQLNVKAGMPVLLYDDGVLADSGEYYFGGAIDSVKARNIPGRVPGVNPVYWDVQCLSWSHLLDRRLVSPFIPGVPPDAGNPLAAPPRHSSVAATAPYGCSQPGQFVNMCLGDLVNQFVYNYCESEGLTTNLGDNVGPVINFFQANGGKDTIAQALDNVAQAGATSTQSWIWWIDPWKKVYFVLASITPTSPWNVDETGAYGDDASILLSVSFETTREKLCNDVLIDSSQTIGAVIAEPGQQGDVSKHSYSTGQPVGGAPTVWITLRDGSIMQRSVAVKGSILQMADWYWALGDNSIEQEVLTTLDGNINADTNPITVITPLRISLDDAQISDLHDSRKYIQIDQEWLRIRSGSTTKTWHVDRGATLRGNSTGANPDKHNNGTPIYLAGLTDHHELFNYTYPPLTKQMFAATNGDSIQSRLSIEGGTGKWQTQISIGYPFYDPAKVQGKDLATAFVDDFGDPPETFIGETYRPGLAIGQVFFVHLLRPPVNDGKGGGINFLIDQLDFTTENKRQKWTFHAINGALIGDWRKAFLGLSDQFAPLAGSGSTLAGAPGKPGTPYWNPNYEVPITGDPLFSKSSFGINQDYITGHDGNPEAQLTVIGAQQKDGSGNPLPLLFKIRREYISGDCAQEAIIDSTKPGQIFLGTHTDPSYPALVADQFKGRIISKLANPEGSTDPLPIQDFTIQTHDALGTFTVTPDPVAAGCATGDVFTIRTGRDPASAASANDSTATQTTYTDPLWNNNYSAGLTAPDGNAGNYALVIGGTGALQDIQKVTANDPTSITVSPGWATLPDATSCVVVVDGAAQVATPQNVNSSPDNFEGVIPVTNYSGMVVRVEGYLNPASITEGTMEGVSMRELYLWGAQGTRVITSKNLAGGMLKTDRVMIFDTSGVTIPPPGTLAADIDEKQVAITLQTAYNPPNGTIIVVGGDEYMYVTDGSGTTNLTVSRGIEGSTAVAHGAGSAVTIGGVMNWEMLPFSELLGQHFIFARGWWLTDVNYVQIVPAAADPAGLVNQLPDNEPYHLLVGTGSAIGSYDFHVPQ